MIAVCSLQYYFCCYVDLGGGGLFRGGELLDGEWGLFLSGSRGVITELVEDYTGLGYREDEWGVNSRGGVYVHHGGY